MTELDKVEWDQIGMPCFMLGEMTDCYNKPCCRLPATEYYKWTDANDVHKAEERGPFTSTSEYIQQYKDNRYSSTLDDKADDEEWYYTELGFHKIIDIILSHPAFNPDPADGFVLQHDDFDLQNILVDSEGNVIGIINWDGSLAMPRCVGHAAVPMFLRNDWLPNTLERAPFMGWRLLYYR
jgi:hypothetical protein